ncbi:TetR/AcrR family transcriptional regulator [Algoriphagus boritolerans]|uniref:Transcriptional regulator, TetR family n=1 Tax=Algoriphagus boritolerans DSM 17298 = JCM 18970 TaxID=1120964 RepID=A0A1H6AGW9_9BACT|nr:TetR/AcrR family transcriptional regulator [Algoriphagus boritolerans]SEG47404.1 transcriptional regulator, TetR family [Algoriphagus boritolerans DSM 17298 = JCM 18970]
MESHIQLKIDENVFTKDPSSSELGKKIIENSIALIDELGFEAFTFGKLADKIQCTEASIYRYFENKHRLLIYHLTWYWTWMEYRLTLATANIKSPEERLKIAIRLLTSPLDQEFRIPQVDEAALYRIVIAESQKVYLTKNVDEENKKGLFFSYKRLCKKAAAIVKEINPEYGYPTALISTIVESSYDQRYFARHLPSLTEIPKDKEDGITEYLTELVFKAIK